VQESYPLIRALVHLLLVASLMRILLVEDEKTLAIPLADSLRDEGHHVTMLHEGPAAMAWLSHNSCDLLITDVRLPGADGIQVLERARHQDPPAACLVMTGYATVEQAVRAMKLGALSYLQKPFPMEALLQWVSQAAEVREMQEEIQRLRAQSKGDEKLGLTGTSLQVQDVGDRIEAAAQSSAVVLIQGASGTGKERVARAIHAKSSRANHAFLPISCAAIPQSLVEGELFGFRKGAFTGADEDHDGLFAQAGEGTVLLDDIEELPLEAQAKLLRVLQERNFTPLGSPRPVPFSAGIIAATKQDLAKRIAAGTFREDLYYRLAVVPLDIPSLRDRPEDISALLGEFLLRFDPEGRYRIHSDTLRQLARYEWPGNVRELENALRRALALSGRARVLRAEHFFPGGPAGDLRGEEILPLREVVRRAETDAIRKAMAYTGGRKIKAADLLGISRKVMWQKMKDLGFDQNPSPAASSTNKESSE
jgi:DNA-binding NtrC family response regulator